MRRLPYVIDNDRHKLADVLNQVLEDHHDLAVDIATAFFNVRGYQCLAERLEHLGSLRLLLGAEPHSGEDLGLKPRLDALQAALRGDLGAEPFRPETIQLVENLIRFLRRDHVRVRLYEQGFLHAKSYLFYGDPKGRPMFDRSRPVLGIVGSSNFTGPGLTTNRELNLVHKGIIPEEEVEDERGRKAALSHFTGDSSVASVDQEDAYEGGERPRVSQRIGFDSRRVIKAEVGAAAIWDLADWFDEQWKQGRDYKEDLIALLDTSKFGTCEYTPYQIYLKALFEYMRADIEDAGGAAVDLYSLNLAEFQADAVQRARRILAKYDGVMICDSVGLGKTWIGLQLLLDYAYHKRWHALVICPAALRPMWKTRLHQTKIQATILGQEHLGREDYDVEPYGQYDVVLVDESHNFRNKSSGRYENLSRLLALNGGRGAQGYRKKIILMTATPISNGVLDLYHQMLFFTRGDNAFFAGAGIGRLDKYFQTARRQLNAGDGSAGRVLANLLEEITIRRTRQFIRKAYPEATIDGKKVNFPKRKLITARYDLEGTYAGIYNKVVRDIENLKLAPYDLETYKTDPTAQDKMMVGRGQALVGIFKSRYLKRLESSVAALRISIFRLMEYIFTFRHYILADVLLEPTDFWKLLGTIEQDLEDDARAQEKETEEDDEDGGRRPQSRHKEIEANPKAKAVLNNAVHLPKGTYDIQSLNDALDADLGILHSIYDLIRPIRPEADKKLLRFRDMLVDELADKKVLIFTSYKDTARYLYEQITKNRTFAADFADRRIRVLHGGTDADTRQNVVQGFAPKSNDKPQWSGTEREIDILISTDVLSEGQNLQDCAYLVNYDLHWNPTRMIQRAGRIDRIGTDFDTLFIRNFFPDEGLEKLLGLVHSLQSKIKIIDDTVGLDASVLGEAINPKVFNTIKRIEGEDESVIDEEEAEAELASDEALARHLVEYIKTSGQEMLKTLPDGIHSGLHKNRARGVFLYYQYRGDSPEQVEHYWRFYDVDNDRIDDNRLVLAELIRCAPDEPRVIDPEIKMNIHKMMEEVENNILASIREQEMTEHAPVEVSRDQSAVLLAIQQIMGMPGIDRKQVMSIHAQLSRPLSAAPVKELKKAMNQFQKDTDPTAFLGACGKVVEKYGRTADSRESRKYAKRDRPTTREDLHLICFDFVS